MASTLTELQPVTMQEAVGYDRIEAATDIALDQWLVLKHDRLFLLLDERGEAAPPGSTALGLFLDDTRILSHYAFHFDGGPPALLSAQVPAHYIAQVDLAISDRLLGGNLWDPKNVVHIRREILVDDCLVERLTISHFLAQPLSYRFHLDLACDFADIFEVRGWSRERRGQYYAPEIGDRSITFRYRGRAGTLLASTVRFAEAPTALSARGARWHLHLEPATSYVLEWQVAPEETMASAAVPVRVALEERRNSLRRAYDEWHGECTRWDSDVEEFDHLVMRAVDDLRALYVEADGEDVISAGIPWYSTVFGRDSILTSLETFALNPRIAVDTLRYLARRQGSKEDPYTEEQPGRILHELRRGEMARAGEIPHTPYFGTVDATPLWLVLLHETWRWTGDADLVRELLPNAYRALEWIERYGDLDGDGFVEYARSSEKGLVNQGWRDSGDGVPFPDGTLPRPPIALVEVQGYVYDARLRMAQLLDALGEPEHASSLREQAFRLRQRIADAFWLPDAGMFALALDGDKRPLPTFTTNAGHLLWSRAATREHAAAVTERLLASDMFSGWGIRTVSGTHPVFNPMSYHNGSVWPHDNALVVMGMAHYGMGHRALPVLDALHDAAIHMKSHRLPELFCGMRRGAGLRPVLYPVSCSPQAWASGAFFLLLQAVLGILPDAPRRTLHVREPQLPRFLNRLTISGLHVGGARIGLEFRRHGTRTLANLLGVEGEPIRVVMELA